jgi:hypothetical protein
MSRVRLASTLALALLALPVAVCLMTACGGDSGSSSDTGTTDTGGGVASADQGFPEFTACDDNTDCAGGEICRDGHCREACDVDFPCEGGLTTCDLDLGYCVENENENECEGDSDCSGGFECLDYTCVPIDDIICEAGRLTCDDNTLVTCSADGTTEERLDCGDRLCVVIDGGGRCDEAICEPDEAGCLDDATAFLCDSTGTVRTEIQCAEDRYCDLGTCLDGVCEPNSVECDGNVIVSCDDLGAPATTFVCSGTLGCSDGECVEGCGDGIVQDGEECDDGNLADGDGCDGCERCSACGFRVEMVWDTPGDPNPIDTGAGRGSDVDLHLLHPDGTWNRGPWDCHWKNKNPDWGASGSEDDPAMVIDDTDGWGPEIIELNQPEGTETDPVAYWVGVYYYSDHNYGLSDVTIRIYLNGVLGFEETFPNLENHQFWDVARITWPSRDIERINRLYPSGFP